jgi:hypothetical protein
MRQNAKNMSTQQNFGVASHKTACATLDEELESGPPDTPLQGKTNGIEDQGPGSSPTNFQEKANSQIFSDPQKAKIENFPAKNLQNENISRSSENAMTPPISGELVPNPLDGYHPAYGQQLIDFFDSHDKYAIITETLVWKSGEVREVQKKVANPPPSFRDFAKKIGVRYKTLELWAKKYPDFLECMEEAQEIYKDFLIENGLLGKYTGEFTKFVAKNKVGMKDQSETKNLNVNFSVNTLLDEIEKKKN